MNSKLLLVLGNGFTIDFLNHFGKTEEIDTSNLFKYGADVTWPGDGSPGFLSYKFCPCLWNLGARTSMSTKDASDLIDEIITCANVYGAAAFSSKHMVERNNPRNIYINAYFELLLYLRHLFVYYDTKIPEFDNSILDKWSWFKFINDAVEKKRYSKITIITYNYDIWLERILAARRIPFYIDGFEPAIEGAIAIIKPHGSISFCHNSPRPRESFFEITVPDLTDIHAPATDFSVKYKDLDQIYPVTPLIPPAGNAERFELELTQPRTMQNHQNKDVSDKLPPDKPQKLMGETANSGDVQTLLSMFSKFSAEAANVDAKPSSDPTSNAQPPQGGVRQSWAADIRARARSASRQLIQGDELLISGISYWHVDRDELDSLLVSVQPSVEVKMINPSVPRSLNAVLTSLFKNYRLFSSARVLRELK